MFLFSYFSKAGRQCSLILLLQNIEGVSSKQVVRLTPDQEASGHPLGPASLVLSPHNIWLSSVGRDGLVRIRETSAMVGEDASPPSPERGSFFHAANPTARSNTSSCSATRTAGVEWRPCRSPRTAWRSSPPASATALLCACSSSKAWHSSGAHMSLRSWDEQQRELLLPKTPLKNGNKDIYKKKKASGLQYLQ